MGECGGNDGYLGHDTRAGEIDGAHMPPSFGVACERNPVYVRETWLIWESAGFHMIWL